MPTNRNMTWVLGLAAAFAAFLALQPKPSSTGEKADTSKQASENKSSVPDQGNEPSASGGGPLKPVWDFILPDQKPRSKAPKWDEWPRPELLQDCSIRFLIVTVPDPVHSELGYLFDHFVEAIEQALEMDGYVVDSAWVPWGRPEQPAGQKQEDPGLSAQLPGLILMRSNPGADEKRTLPPGLCASAVGLMVSPLGQGPLLMSSTLYSGETAKTLWAVFLVGETPTAGVQKAAFMNSVRLIKSCPAFKPEGDRIRVVGPSFSGSATSLAMLLKGIQVKPEPGRAGKAIPPIKVVCGSATGFEQGEFVEEWWLGDSFVSEPEFETTIYPDHKVRDCIYRYLDHQTSAGQTNRPKTIIILQESNTGFGQESLGQEIKQETEKQAANQREGGKKPAHQKEDKYIIIPFPIHISQLRASFSKEQLAKGESLGLPRPSINLPFPQDEGEDSRNSSKPVPAQAPMMTAATNDLVLSNIVTTLAQYPAHYVGLIASDVRDKIFLAGLIRQRVPDVQLFTTGADLLLAHSDYNYAMRGMIVGSTYSLYPPDQRRSDVPKKDVPKESYKRRIFFSADFYEGVYNATTVQINSSNGVLGYEQKPDNLLDYGWQERDSQTTRPPIWISVVGQNGRLIPLKCFSQKEIEEDSKSSEQDLFMYQRTLPSEPEGGPPAPDSPKKGAPPGGYGAYPNLWFLSFLALLILSSYGFFLTCVQMARSTWTDTAAAQMSASKQRIDFGVVCIALMVLYGGIAKLSLVPIREPPKDGVAALTALATWGVFLISLVVLVLVPGALLWAYFGQGTNGYAANFRRRWADYRGINRAFPPMTGTAGIWKWSLTLNGKKYRPFHGIVQGRSWLILTETLVLLVTVCLFLWFFLSAVVGAFGQPEIQDGITFQRVVHLSNGVSPLVPRFFLCATFFAWGAFLVKKLFLVNQFSVLCPFPDSGSKTFQSFHKLDDKIRSELMPPSTLQQHPFLCLGLFVLLVSCFLELYRETIPPIDGMPFACVALGGFFLGSFLLVFTLCQFYLAWKRLKRMLRFLALLPMADAFDRLPDKVVAVFGHYLTTVRPRYSHLAISVQQFELLRGRFQAFRTLVQRSSLGLLEDAGGVERSLLARVFRQLTVFPDHKVDQLPESFQGELDPLGEEDYEVPTPPIEKDDPKRATQIVSYVAKSCLGVLPYFWPSHSMEEAFGRPLEAEKGDLEKVQFLSLPEGNAVREWVRAAEDFVAIEIIRYVSQYFVQLRNLLTSLTVGSLLLLLAASSYPFHPQQLLLLFLTLLGGTVVFAIFAFLVQINRDELVSRITKTTPNQFTPDLSFVQGTFTYIIPILGALMVQFPFFTSGIRALLDPLLHIIQ